MESPTLPVELIVKILSRLPVKSLLRFRCLSKQFCSIIDGSHFINLHLQHSIETNSNLSLILSFYKRPFCSRIYSVSLDSPYDCVEVNHPFNILREYGTYDTSVIGSCNGLVVVRNCEERILLLNPSTKQHHILPKFDKWWDGYDDYLDGFGYDAANDDYKFVRISVFSFPYYNDVTVYSLKNDSWRRIKDVPEFFVLNVRNGAFASGALHWVVSDHPTADVEYVTGSALHWVVNYHPVADVGYLMLAFDLGSEEFYKVAMPDVEDGGFFTGVEALRGCLCVVHMYDTQQPCDVWVMKEYGVVDSWTKLFTLQEGVIGSCDFVQALAYSKSGDKVLVVKNQEDLYWYDLKEQRVESCVEIDGGVRGYGLAITCVDSLVSLNAYGSR